MGRKPKQETEIIYSGGAWHAYVYMGRGSDGRTKRVHRQATAPEADGPPAAFVDTVRKLEADRDANRPIAKGQKWKFERWLDYWLATIAPLKAGHNTLEKTYGNSIRNYLKPMLGGFHLDELTTSKFTALYRQLQREGLAESTIGLIHATARTAMNAAVSEGVVGVNVVARATAPAVKTNSPESLTDEEVQRVLEVLRRHPDPARWYLLLLGLRQGEVLGLGVEHYEREAGIVRIRRQLQRRTYRHGCGDAKACAEPHCRTVDCPGRVWVHGCNDPQACAEPRCNRTVYPWEANRLRKTTRRSGAKPCEPSCTGHARACPSRVKGECARHKRCQPCPDGCMGHAQKCPQRTGGLVLVDLDTAGEAQDEAPVQQTRGRKRKRSQDEELDPKSAAGKRRAALPEFAIEAMDRRLKIRAEQRETASSLWRGDEWGNTIFCDGFGVPIAPKRDWEGWGDLLAEARVRYREPHVGRRTAATVMLKMKVDRRIVMAFFGWSSEAMLKRYQDVPDELLAEAAASMGDRYLGGSATRSATGAGLEGVFVRTEG
jgi:integrase